MTILPTILKHAVAAALLIASGPVLAQERNLDDLFEALKSARGEAVTAIEHRIYEEWSRSGSPSMDLLLERGRKAMEEQDWDLAIAHFTALTDHAPDFAEGWNARATAYFQAERYGQALADIQRTLALNPRHFGALSGLAIILERIDEEEAALEAWREVAKISPNREGLEENVQRLERSTIGESL